MATGKMSEVVQHLRRAVLLQDGAGLTDGQLLESFVSCREEAAVAALVRRHGAMVWGVCHRVLPSHQDADDAFQATFLVLLRKAASIMPRDMVANWLYGVAQQTALKAKQIADKRRGRERCLMDMPEPKGAEQDRSHDLQLVLDQELSRLPDKYRAVIVLCDLQGKSRKEAARQLNVPEGTIASRIATARTKLAKRLARHGLALGGGSLAAVLSQSVASASVPAGVLSSTIKAVTLVAAGKATATGLISANVAALTEGVIKAMLLTKLKMMMVLLLLLSMVTLTGVMRLAWGQTGPASTGNKGKGVEKPALKAEKQKAHAQPKDPPKDFTNSIGMKFVWIKPGTFMMGSPKEEKEREPLKTDETQHQVTLTQGYYMGVYTVTQEEWQAIMGKNPSNFKGEKNLPVDSVSWDDCQQFIKKLRAKDKKLYRLPTESEWEYSCRAGTTTPFHFGETISTDQANYDGNLTYGTGKKGVCRKKTTPVGSFPANAWGLFDMHGNVCQWCQDRNGDYPQKDVVDPQGPEKGEKRVLRGGSWVNFPLYCRSACRIWIAPGLRGFGCGFRVCFSLEQEAKPNDNPKDADADKEQPLTVTIKPEKDRIRVNEPFEVDFLVVNSSKASQSFQVWSFSDDQWKSSNERVSCKEWVKQYMFNESPQITKVKLAPGEVYKKTWVMLVLAGKPQEKVSFKISFTPRGSKQTFWSNEVTLQVDREEKSAEAPELPADLVAAWKKADARVGWMSVDRFGGFGWFREDTEGKKGEVPAFAFFDWTAGVVAKLPQPQTVFGLDLSFTGDFAAPLTDAGLKELTGLKSLQSLNLGRTKITDAGLKELAGLKSLQSLNLRNTKVTDAGLKELAGMESLLALNLIRTEVTDAGLKDLARAKNLQSLTLHGYRISNAGVRELAGLKSLQSLHLIGTYVTGAGAVQLQKALPALRIIREQ